MPCCVPFDVYRLYLPSDVSRKYSKPFKIIGIAHIVIGVISIIMEAGAVIFFIQRLNHYPSIAPGIWAGLLFIITGIFSYLSGATSRYCHVICGMVFSVVSFLAAGVMVACNAYFAKLFLEDQEEAFQLTTYNEDTKLIPPLFILIATGSLEILVTFVHFPIACATTRICFCGHFKRELRDTEIRMTYPHNVSTISRAVMRTDSFQFHGAYDTVTTQIYPTFERRLFSV